MQKPWPCSNAHKHMVRGYRLYTGPKRYHLVVADQFPSLFIYANHEYRFEIYPFIGRMYKLAVEHEDKVTRLYNSRQWN